MALAEIAPLAEIVEVLGLGSTLTDADRGLLWSSKGRVENAVRRFCRHNITQPTDPYVHYLPAFPGRRRDLGYDTLELLPSGKAMFGSQSMYGDVLQLPQIWLRSIVEIREDLDALAGSGASIFTSDTLLTENVDYRADWDEPGFCGAGQIIRVGVGWPAGPRTIRAIYVSGLTADELDDAYSDIKDVVIDETVSRFKHAKSRSGSDGAAGPIKMEMIGREYQVEYDTSVRYSIQLSDDSKETLEPFIAMSLQ